VAAAVLSGLAGAAFAALGRLRAGGTRTRAVAVAGPETPEALIAAADEVVAGPAAVLALLESLAGTAH
jgi:hypothetical protein